MEKTICIFGDSIVWGACDYERGGWVSRLRNYVETREEGEVEAYVYNCGIGGDNSELLLERFNGECVSREPNTIIFAIGINDSQYINSKDNPRISIENFEKNLEKLIEKAKKYTNEIIFVGLSSVDDSRTVPVPWETSKNYDMENVTLYNEKIKEICKKSNLLFVDVLDLIENAELVDGLHPDSQGHEKIFQRIKNFLLENKII